MRPWIWYSGSMRGSRRVRSKNKLRISQLALLWQTITNGKVIGFPNQFFNDSWVVGLARAVSGTLGSQGAAAHVSALRSGADRAWRSQERSANGGTSCAERL